MRNVDLVITEWDGAERIWWKAHPFRHEVWTSRVFGIVPCPPRSTENVGEFSVIANVFAFAVLGYCAIRILRSGHAAQNVSSHVPDIV